MQCQSCGKTGFVSIGIRRYCSTCGAGISAPSKASMSDLRPATGRAAATNSQNHSRAVPRQAAPKSASLHRKAKVLDLRSSARTISAAAATSAATTKLITATPPKSPHELKPAPPRTTAVPQDSRAAEVQIQNIRTRPKTAATPITLPGENRKPQPDAAALARLSRVAATPKHPAVHKFDSQTKHPAAPLPPQVASEIARMKSAAARAADLSQPQSSGALQAILDAARPRRQLSAPGIAAALAAIVVMGGVIYAQNAPKLAFRNAASRAGIEASLPTYLPSSYQQTGPVGVRPGEISINFSGTTAQDNLNITQRKTDWDASSLRENYVARQTDKFLAVKGQGLTIYIYNNNQASWVNHGIWYNIVGTTKLNREQILKIAYGL